MDRFDSAIYRISALARLATDTGTRLHLVYVLPQERGLPHACKEGSNAARFETKTRPSLHT
jgi:hypothetical protein